MKMKLILIGIATLQFLTACEITGSLSLQDPKTGATATIGVRNQTKLDNKGVVELEKSK